jgi:hypothetical protein
VRTMKYALWRMLTRVGRVLSLRARHALKAALKSVAEVQ